MVNRTKELDDDDFTFILDVNLKGIIHYLRAQIKHIENEGNIVIISSIDGLVGYV